MAAREVVPRSAAASDAEAGQRQLRRVGVRLGDSSGASRVGSQHKQPMAGGDQYRQLSAVCDGSGVPQRAERAVQLHPSLLLGHLHAALQHSKVRSSQLLVIITSH